MSVLENGQHELFVQKWHETSNKTEAYKYAFPDQSGRWKEATINNEASRISKLNEVATRYKELTQESADNHGITIAGLLLELEAARKMAMSPENAQSSGAVSATMSKAKLVGLDVIKIEVSSKEKLTPWDGITFGPPDDES
jgi:hypothetical protein